MSSWLKKQELEEPSLASTWVELDNLLSNNLYFQFTELLSSIRRHPSFQHDTKLVDLYTGLLRPLLRHIDLLIVAGFVLEAAAQVGATKGLQSRLDFLLETVNDFQECGQADIQALMVLKSAVAGALVELHRLSAACTLIEEIQASVSASKTPVDHSVSAALETTLASYCLARGDYDGYYDHSMLRLAFMDASEFTAMDDATALSVAVDVAQAAMVGSRSFSFHSLATHPLMTRVRGSRFSWLAALVDAFAAADLNTFEKLRPEFIRESPLLAHKVRVLDAKIRILVITEMVLARPGFDRAMNISELAKTVGLSEVQVELLLLKAFEIGALDGVIDPLKGTVNITRVLPRDLTKLQIQNELLPQFSIWISRVEDTLHTLKGVGADMSSKMSAMSL